MLLPGFYSCLFLFSLLSRHAHSLGVAFLKPLPGGTYTPEAFEVSWTDGGGYPDINNLTIYTLQLVVGGNTLQDSKILTTIGTPNSSVATGHVTDDIPANLTQSIEDGFYLIMTSNTTGGDQVINYSDRFTLIAVNGTTPDEYVEAAMGQAGSPTNVPGAQYNQIAHPSASASPIPSPTPTPSTTDTPPSHPVTDDDGDTGISEGALIGLIIGAVLAFVGIISLLVWAYMLGRRIRQNGRAKKQNALDTKRSRLSKAAFVDGKSELPADSISSAELGASPTELSPYPERFEAPGWAKAAEVPGDNIVYELEGDWSGWEAGSGRRSKAWDPTL